MQAPLVRLELRLAAVAGWLGAAVILVNAAKRAELLPTGAVAQLLAPLAQVFALGLVLGLYVAYRRSGVLLTVGLAANVMALAALVGVEFVANLVLEHLESAQVEDLLAGPLGAALVTASVLFLSATLVFAAALWRSGAPRTALVLYAAAAFPIALRAFVPEAALQIGLVVLAAAVLWLAVDVWRRAPAAA